MPILHLICGLPGSGKTTFARQLEEQGTGVRLSPDEWMTSLGLHLYDEAARERVEQLQWTLAQRLLSAGTDVILENGFWSKEERDSYRATAQSLGCDTRLHFLDVPVEELQRRIIAHNRDAPPDAVVDPDDVLAWSKMFEPPTADELAVGHGSPSR